MSPHISLLRSFDEKNRRIYKQRAPTGLYKHWRKS